ncbi:hypothetical protein N7451_002988 [Penicillium sp. IBT 35674x]|nr:hypothetical protein N7451_002988 [Penicillium sp. IBT 35674x]
MIDVFACSYDYFTMSIHYTARSRPQLIQEAIDHLFVEFGATVENRDWAAEQTQQPEESCVLQVLRDYESGAFPNGRVILAHDSPISESEVTPSDILIDLQVYQTWRSNPSEHLPRKPLYEMVEVPKDENRTCSICYELCIPRDLILNVQTTAMTESPHLWMDFVSSNQTYRRLKDLKERGWKNQDGDRFFEERRKTASNPTQSKKESFYQMTCHIGSGLAEGTDIFKSDPTGLKVLDLCMAPGGFTTAAANNLWEPLIDGITLPPQIGGYEVLAKKYCQHIIYADITMYPTEMGYEGPIPEGHPDASHFDRSRPLLDNTYDIVICGGAVGRDHPREEYRQNCEGTRLTVSQMVFAMNHLNPAFSEIQLYKHPKCHAIKSSFYLIAKNVNLGHPVAKQSASHWRNLWGYLTFKDFEDVPLPDTSLHGSDDAFVRSMIDDFGPQFQRIAQPVWKCQAKALRKQSFTK